MNDDDGASARRLGGNDQPLSGQPAEAPPPDIGNTETDKRTDVSWNMVGTNVSSDFTLTIPSSNIDSYESSSATPTNKPAPVVMSLQAHDAVEGYDGRRDEDTSGIPPQDYQELQQSHHSQAYLTSTTKRFL